ncbi:MAG: methionyl-tRNA formyltransferase [Endomicrobium sp.]|jgi:methionyl-tRNA formyltransferase|nr:methionyl-tRNA formyltransferase [Endomicrobium sp.]
MNILFFGTSSVSRYYLEELYKNSYKILVVTKFDKIIFNKNKSIQSEVKTYAVENNIDFIQVDEFTNNIINEIKKFNADIGIVVSYGKFIPSNIYNIPKFKTFNIHFSLLPKFRGASPVQYALCNGEVETGVSSFFIEDNFDTGNIIIQKKLTIDANDTAYSLLNRLIQLGITVMNNTIKLLYNNEYNVSPQIGSPSFAPSLKKKDGLIDWGKSANVVYNKFRGLYVWPNVYSVVKFGKLSGKKIIFIEMEIFDNYSVNKNFGTVHSIEKNSGFIVLCAVGKILITKVKIENKHIMYAWNFMQGKQLLIGDSFC